VTFYRSPRKSHRNPTWWDRAVEEHHLINKGPIKSTTKGNIVIAHQEGEQSSISHAEEPTNKSINK